MSGKRNPLSRQSNSPLNHRSNVAHTRACVCALLGAALAGCVATQPGGTVGRPASPSLLDGRVEPTIAAPKTAHTNEAGRVALARLARASRDRLLNALPPPLTLCRAARGKVRIDGKLDEPAWQSAQAATGFRLTRKLSPAQHDTRVKLLWDRRFLYIGFECPDTDVLATITNRDGDLWMEDAAELFIDADADGMSYIEIEISPRNVIYDAAVADYRPEVDWGDDLVHLDMPGSIRRYDAPGIRSAVSVNGTVNDSSDTDEGWSCELALPWSDVARGTNVDRIPPRDGDVWRIGLYRININHDKQRDPDEYAAWNPTTSWFHVPWLFGRVRFVE